MNSIIPTNERLVEALHDFGESIKDFKKYVGNNMAKFNDSQIEKILEFLTLCNNVYGIIDRKIRSKEEIENVARNLEVIRELTRRINLEDVDELYDGVKSKRRVKSKRVAKSKRMAKSKRRVKSKRVAKSKRRVKSKRRTSKTT